MRYVTFEVAGKVRLGALEGDKVAALSYLPDGVADLRDLIAARGPEGLASAEVSSSDVWALDKVDLLPPVPNPQKIICVGVNYRTHRDETGHTTKQQPTIFTRFADTQIGHLSNAIRPRATDRFDYEGELAVVIGRHASAVPAEDAWSYIAGLSVYNDFSVRDWQKHSTQWIPGKNFIGTGAFGPALVTLDEVTDFESLSLTTRVNGEVRQHASLRDLLFDVPTLVAYITAFTALAPGDVIVTGTPGGVGQFMDPPTFLADGDDVEVEISTVGVLRNRVADESGAGV